MVMTRGDLVKKLLGVRNVKSLVVLLPQGLGWEDEVVFLDQQDHHVDIDDVKTVEGVIVLETGPVADCCEEGVHVRRRE